MADAGDSDRENEDENGDESGGGALGGVMAEASVEAERLQRGRALSFFGNPLPVRTLIAFLVFLIVFLLVWVALWAAMGGAGLGLGWIPAAVLGTLAVGIWGRTVWAD